MHFVVMYYHSTCRNLPNFIFGKGQGTLPRKDPALQEIPPCLFWWVVPLQEPCPDGLLCAAGNGPQSTWPALGQPADLSHKNTESR